MLSKEFWLLAFGLRILMANELACFRRNRNIYVLCLIAAGGTHNKEF